MFLYRLFPLPDSTTILPLWLSKYGMVHIYTGIKSSRLSCPMGCRQSSLAIFGYKRCIQVLVFMLARQDIIYVVLVNQFRYHNTSFLSCILFLRLIAVFQRSSPAGLWSLPAYGWYDLPNLATTNPFFCCLAC